MSLPLAIEEVDARWLGDVLHASGSLPTGAAVSSLAVECVGAGIGLLGSLHRVRYRAGSTGEEASVVVKLPADNELRATADALGLYRREVDFYQQLAGAVPLTTPRAHLALPAAETTDFVLVLEDLGGLVAGDQLAGLAPEQADAAVDAIAGLHAWAWGDDDLLARLSPSFPPLRNETTLALYPGYFGAGWASYLSRSSREPGPELRAVAGRWGSDLPSFLDDLAAPATLCHGDYRADNLFFGRDGAVSVIDFQLVHQGSGMSDVAYLVSQSIDGAEAADHERLVRRYCSALEALGITYPWDEAWHRYRVAVIFHVIEALVTTLSWPSLGERGRRLVLRLVERAEEAIRATGAVGVLA
jgi:hypothetical protein